MKLGFVSAILPDYTLEQVFRFARDAGFSSVELMCWPPGKAERRYAGVTHLDVTDLSLDAIEKIQDLAAIQQVAISGLGYYPNPLSADRGRVGARRGAPPPGDRRRGGAGRRAWSTRSSAATRPCRSTTTGRGSWRSGGR